VYLALGEWLSSLDAHATFQQKASLNNEEQQHMQNAEGKELQGKVRAFQFKRHSLNIYLKRCRHIFYYHHN